MDGTDFSLQGMKYLLNKRGLTLETIKERMIGICHHDTDLPEPIKHLGEEHLAPEERRDFSYFILGRIIVPIHDEFGKIVAFGTRSINHDDGTTWWNTPFPKSNHLFLLGKSKKSIFESNKVYLVEGYMDAIVLQQCGIHNAVAVMGTNLSLRQMGLMARYCSNICFCFDVDKNSSGQKAQKRSIMAVNRFKIFDELSVIFNLFFNIEWQFSVSSLGLTAAGPRSVLIRLIRESCVCLNTQFDMHPSFTTVLISEFGA